MAKKIICDRCGKEIKKNRDYFSLFAGLKYASMNYENLDSDMDVNYELCEDCMDEVLMLIGGPEE